MSAVLKSPAPTPEAPPPPALAGSDAARSAWEQALVALTKGLAHDFGNDMARIHAVSESFLDQVGPEHAFAEGLGQIKTSSQHASRLLRRILSLYQDTPGESDYHNFYERVADAAELVRKVLPRPMEFVLETAAASWPVYLDAVAFRQAVIHLVLHVSAALPPDGCLVLRVNCPEPERTVRLSVCDESFIAPVQPWDRVFDPHRAAPRQDPEADPGLQFARRFAEKHQGRLVTEIVAGRRPTLHLSLPLADFTEHVP